MPPEHGAFVNGVVRQLTLKAYDQCPLRAIAEARRPFTDYTSAPAALGTATHMVFEEILRTLKRTGEVSIPTEEALVIMREVSVRPDFPHLSDDALRDLRVLTLQVAALEWKAASRILWVEERFTCAVPCPDGRERIITGQPDVVAAAPPDGALVLDLKTSWAVPPAPRDGDWDRDHGRPYLSERGTFQLDVLGLLVMRNLPAVQWVALHEYYPRLNEFRKARLERHELEHVEQRLGILVQRFEADLASDQPAEPRPGKWCSHCPIVRDCPVPQEDRGEGFIDSPDAADAEAARWMPVRSLSDAMRKSLKAWHEETGHAPAVGDGRTVRWRTRDSGSRSFDAHEPEGPPPRDDTDYEALLQASVEQARGEA